MSDRLPRPLQRLLAFMGAWIDRGTQNDLMLFAPAIAYSILLSIAPLVVAVSYFTARLLPEAVGVLDNLPIDAGGLTAEQIVGGAAVLAGPAEAVAAFLLVIIGATALFRQVNGALTRIWRQPGGPQGLRAFARSHLFSLLLFAIAGLALIVSAIAGNVLSALSHVLEEADSVAGIDFELLESLLTSRLLVDFIFSAVLFTVSFVTVPRIRPRVRDILPGALVTAGAYAVGQVALSSYLASTPRFTALGTFGSLLGFLVWAYYTALILLWGAELSFQIGWRRARARGGPKDMAPYAHAESAPDAPRV